MASVQILAKGVLAEVDVEVELLNDEETRIELLDSEVEVVELDVELISSEVVIVELEERMEGLELVEEGVNDELVDKDEVVV
jgi:protein involved in polysaccharide export with SLBB domain